MSDIDGKILDANSDVESSTMADRQEIASNLIYEESIGTDDTSIVSTSPLATISLPEVDDHKDGMRNSMSPKIPEKACPRFTVFEQPSLKHPQSRCFETMVVSTSSSNGICHHHNDPSIRPLANQGDDVEHIVTGVVCVTSLPPVCHHDRRRRRRGFFPNRCTTFCRVF